MSDAGRLQADGQRQPAEAGADHDGFDDGSFPALQMARSGRAAAALHTGTGGLPVEDAQLVDRASAGRRRSARSAAAAGGRSAAVRGSAGRGAAARNSMRFSSRKKPLACQPLPGRGTPRDQVHRPRIQARPVRDLVGQPHRVAAASSRWSGGTGPARRPTQRQRARPSRARRRRCRRASAIGSTPVSSRTTWPPPSRGGA